MATNDGKTRDSIDRTNLIWKWGTVGATLFIFLLLFLIPNYMRDYQRRAGEVWGGIGIVLLITAGLLAWFSDRHAKHWTYYLGWLVLLALGIAAACGFDFGNFGIPERP